MIEQSIQAAGYLNLHVYGSSSMQALGRYESNDRSDAGRLHIRQDMYFDFQMTIQYRSENDIRTQAGQFDPQKWKEFSIPASDTSGIPISPLQDLISENGYFGIKETSGRIAEFVVNGAGDDIEKLKAGREGMLRGFKEAEKIWGGLLPEISYATIDQALKEIDEKIYALGGSIVDTTA